MGVKKCLEAQKNWLEAKKKCLKNFLRHDFFFNLKKIVLRFLAFEAQKFLKIFLIFRGTGFLDVFKIFFWGKCHVFPIFLWHRATFFSWHLELCYSQSLEKMKNFWKKFEKILPNPPSLSNPPLALGWFERFGNVFFILLSYFCM